MVSKIFLILIAITMIGVALSDQKSCNDEGAKTATVTKSSCLAESGDDKCCYITFSRDGTPSKGCAFMTKEVYTSNYADALAALKQGFATNDLNLDCGQSFVSLSFLVLAIFAFLF